MVRVKRLVVSCLLAGSLLAAFAGGAGAAANPEHANCVGQYLSSRTITGRDISGLAREAGGAGQFFGSKASTNCGQR